MRCFSIALSVQCICRRCQQLSLFITIYCHFHSDTISNNYFSILGFLWSLEIFRFLTIFPFSINWRAVWSTATLLSWVLPVSSGIQFNEWLSFRGYTDLCIPRDSFSKNYSKNFNEAVIIFGYKFQLFHCYILDTCKLWTVSFLKVESSSIWHDLFSHVREDIYA